MTEKVTVALKSEYRTELRSNSSLRLLLNREMEFAQHLVKVFVHQTSHVRCIRSDEIDLALLVIRVKRI